MKLFSSKKKAAILGALVGVMTLGSVAFAANTPIKLDAFYDTFKLNVNGTQQYINDRQFKPFIADSRIYIPLSTLNQLGVVNAQWDASTASVNITPSGTSSSGEVALYQQQLAALNVQLQAKTKEAEDLKAENTRLGAEVDKLKKENNSSSSTSDSRALRDLEDTFNRSRTFSRYSGGRDVGVIDFEFRVEAYRNDVEIKMYINDKLTSDQVKLLREDYRYFDEYMTDISKEAVKTFKDATVYITIYNGEYRNSPTKIGDYTYDGRRISGRIN